MRKHKQTLLKDILNSITKNNNKIRQNNCSNSNTNWAVGRKQQHTLLVVNNVHLGNSFNIKYFK